MLSVFSNPIAFTTFLGALVVAVFGLWGVVLREQSRKRTTDRSQQSIDYGRIVGDAVKLKQEFQEDYELIRRRLVDLEAQVGMQRQRILSLETENQHLRQQLIGAGIPIVVDPSNSPPAPTPTTRPRRTTRAPRLTIVDDEPDQGA